jgi:hypothetical protein
MVSMTCVPVAAVAKPKSAVGRKGMADWAGERDVG